MSKQHLLAVFSPGVSGR